MAHHLSLLLLLLATLRLHASVHVTHMAAHELVGAASTLVSSGSGDFDGSGRLDELLQPDDIGSGSGEEEQEMQESEGQASGEEQGSGSAEEASGEGSGSESGEASSEILPTVKTTLPVDDFALLAYDVRLSEGLIHFIFSEDVDLTSVNPNLAVFYSSKAADAAQYRLSGGDVLFGRRRQGELLLKLTSGDQQALQAHETILKTPSTVLGLEAGFVQSMSGMDFGGLAQTEGFASSPLEIETKSEMSALRKDDSNHVEGWQAALVVVVCVIGFVLIVIGIVLGVRERTRTPGLAAEEGEGSYAAFSDNWNDQNGRSVPVQAGSLNEGGAAQRFVENSIRSSSV